jgi:hypothetical protein
MRVPDVLQCSPSVVIGGLEDEVELAGRVDSKKNLQSCA